MPHLSTMQVRYAKNGLAVIGMSVDESGPAPVRRPTYSVLENSRAKLLGATPMPDWKTALIDFLHAQYH